MRGDNQPAYEQDMQSGYTRYEVPLSQGVWTRVVEHCSARTALSIIPTSNQILLTFGQTAPVAIPTQINPYQWTPDVLTKVMSPAMIRGPLWCFTLIIGVTLIITDEQCHCSSPTDPN